MNSLQRCKPLLGTYVEVSVSGEACDQDLIHHSQLAFNAIEDVQHSMSFHDSSSELSRLNEHALHTKQPISTQMRSVLAFAHKLNDVSVGAFDPCVASELIAAKSLPRHGFMQTTLYDGSWKDIELDDDGIQFHRPLLIDLGGIAKGFAVDQAIATIPNELQATVNAGGDLKMTHWQAESVDIIEHRGHQFGTRRQAMLASSLASSASYYVNEADNQLSSVIINPKTKSAHQQSRTISVFSSSCMKADALCKVAWLLKESAPHILMQSLNKFNATQP